jgi:hypothetical protein
LSLPGLTRQSIIPKKMDARAFAAPKGFGPAGGLNPRMTN